MPAVRRQNTANTNNAGVAMVIYTWVANGDTWYSDRPEADLHDSACVVVSRWCGVTVAWSATSLTHTCKNIDDGMRVAFGDP